MPHDFLGLGFSDWVALATLLGLGFAWLNSTIKQTAKSTTDDDLRELSRKLDNFKYDLRELQTMINQLKKTTERMSKIEETVMELEKRVIRLEEHVK